MRFSKKYVLKHHKVALVKTSKLSQSCAPGITEAKGQSYTNLKNYRTV
jgi:hypothetical protein